MSNRSRRTIFSMIFSAVFMMCWGGEALAQDAGSAGDKQSGEAAPKPASKKEEKAYRDFATVAPSDTAKKLASGETFAKDYPDSRYLKYVYPYIVIGYIQAGQMEKAIAAGQKDLTINPQDVRTMAALSQSLARAYNPMTPNAANQLVMAEDYGKKALAGLETLTKPEGMTDEHFAQLKGDTQSMALSGIGLVLLRQDKFTEAIPDLEKASSLDATDQTNFYLLGVAEMNTQHFSEAVVAFKKCAAMTGNLQTPCSDGAKDAQSHAK